MRKVQVSQNKCKMISYEIDKKREWNESWMDMKFSRYFLINFSKLIIFHEINPFVLFSSAI